MSGTAKFLALVPRGRGADEREFLPAALEIIETPASPVGRAVGFVIVLAAVTAVVWASLAKVDIITSAPGRIVPVGRSKIVQPFVAGIVQSINVNDGDHVAAGETLIVLDPTAAQADARRVGQDLLDAQLDRARLQGLVAVFGSIAPPVLKNLPAGAPAADVAAAGAEMQAQALEEAGKIADIDQQIAEKKFEAAQAVANVAKVATDKPFLSQVAGMRTQLMQAQVGSKLDWLTAQQQLADTGPNAALARAQEEAAKADMAALLQQRAETVAEYQKGVLSDLAAADQKIDEAAQDLVKARQQVALTTLTAPIAGTVQQLAVHTLGGVVSPGQALLTIVPDNQRLMVEASVKNLDIGFVHPGQIADIKIGAFDFTRFGTIKGTVTSISRDVVDNSPNQAPQNDGYGNGADPDGQTKNQDGLKLTQQEPEYVAHITLPLTSILTDAGPTQLQPGMAITADIRTGRRSIISYLLSPFMHQIDEAGHER